MNKNKAMLTFRAFFAASAPERLSKVTNPTGWKAKGKKHTVTPMEEHLNIYEPAFVKFHININISKCIFFKTVTQTSKKRGQCILHFKKSSANVKGTVHPKI